MREALPALGVGAGIEHGVHRVGAPPPALLRAVCIEALRQREEARTTADARGTLAPLVLGVRTAMSSSSAAAQKSASDGSSSSSSRPGPAEVEIWTPHTP